MREQGLGGGKEVPPWTDPGLPFTYTSSHMIMTAEIDATTMRAATKRKAEDEAAPNVRMPVKRPRRGSMRAELQKMKEAAEMKRRATETEQDRYPCEDPELRHALQRVDARMRSATETQNQNAALETMVLRNEAQYIEDMDKMYNEWGAYNKDQETKANRVLEAYDAEIRTRGIRIETLDAEGKRLRSLIERQKQKLGIRDRHLAAAKRRWVQQRAFLEKNYEAIREIAEGIDEQVRVELSSYLLDDGGSDYGAEAEEDGDKDEEEAEETGMEKEDDDDDDDDDDDEEEDDAEETTTTDKHPEATPEATPHEPTRKPQFARKRPQPMPIKVTAATITQRETETETEGSSSTSTITPTLLLEMFGYRIPAHRISP